LGWDIAVGMETCYRLDSPQIESQSGVKYSTPVQTGLGAHPASNKRGTGSFSWGYSGWGVALTTHLHLAPRLKKE